MGIPGKAVMCPRRALVVALVSAIVVFSNAEHSEDSVVPLNDKPQAPQAPSLVRGLDLGDGASNPGAKPAAAKKEDAKATAAAVKKDAKAEAEKIKKDAEEKVKKLIGTADKKADKVIKQAKEGEKAAAKDAKAKADKANAKAKKTDNKVAKKIAAAKAAVATAE